jgi:hypothetical protein
MRWVDLGRAFRTRLGVGSWSKGTGAPPLVLGVDECYGCAQPLSRGSPECLSGHSLPRLGGTFATVEFVATAGAEPPTVSAIERLAAVVALDHVVNL